MPDSTAVTEGRFYEHQAPGAVRVFNETYTAAAALAANSVIKMMPVKAGTKIIDMKVKFSAFGTGRTVDIGDGGDVDRFLDGGDVAAAGVLSCSASAGFFHEYDADDTIDITVLGGTMPLDGTIELTATYTMRQ